MSDDRKLPFLSISTSRILLFLELRSLALILCTFFSLDWLWWGLNQHLNRWSQMLLGNRDSKMSIYILVKTSERNQIAEPSQKEKSCEKKFRYNRKNIFFFFLEGTSWFILVIKWFYNLNRSKIDRKKRHTRSKKL